MNHEPLTGATPGEPSGRVVIVGAGPTGLALAGELALAGIPCRMLERRALRTHESRAFILHARTMEQLALRGLADEAVTRCHPVARLQLGSTGRVVDFGGLDSRFPYLTIMPQNEIQDILERRARQFGVEIIRGAEVVGLRQDATGVTLSITGEAEEWEEHAAYAVGCDGADSVLREMAGIPLEGDTLDFGAVLADVRLRRPPVTDFMVRIGSAGAMVSAPYTDGWYRITCLDRCRPFTDEPVTLEELRASLSRVTGLDMDPYAPRWLARFRVHERLADRYRHGRVLLAGDSAHLHSPLGGQGMNLGIQDAFNLGWKLAAVLGGWAPARLLDSYGSERRPVAEDVIRVTGHGTAVMKTASPFARSARALALNRMLQSPFAQRRIREALSGIAIRYRATAQEGAMAGRRVPDLPLVLPDGRLSRLYEHMTDGRFTLLDLTPCGESATAAAGWADRVRPLVADLEDGQDFGGALAVLVRPDGYAAWSTAAESPAERVAECRAALARWCGPEYGDSARCPVRPGADEPLDVLDELDAALFRGPETVRFGVENRRTAGGEIDAAP